MNSFVLSSISMGKITNLKFQLYVLNSHGQSWTTLFCIFSLQWPFHTNFFPVSIPKMYGDMHEIYISWLGSYIQQISNATKANVKCIGTWWYVGKKRKNIFMASFYGRGSTASRLTSLRGGSLLFTTKFPEIPGTHFINLRRMKGWVNLEPTQCIWTPDPWIRKPACWPLDH